MVDTLGLVWSLVITAANKGDRDGARQAFEKLRPHACRLEVVYADGNYDGPLEEQTQTDFGFRLEIVQKPPDQKGFSVLPRRWIVERTFAWGGKYRRLRSDYEFEPESSRAMFLWAMVHRMLRRLEPG